MLTTERWKVILSTLKEKGTAHVTDLVEVLSVSESTIRRDLSELERRDLLVRIHGGAQLKPVDALEPRFLDKMERYQAEKIQIARYAAQLVEPYDCIFVDAGTTTLSMGESLAQIEGLIVVTNGVPQATQFAEWGINVAITGGVLKGGTQAVVGPMVTSQLRYYNFDKAFIGMNGIHPQSGYTTPDMQEAMAKRVAMEQSRQTYVLADHSKFGAKAFAHVADMAQAQIITNRIDPTMHDEYSQHTQIKEVDPS